MKEFALIFRNSASQVKPSPEEMQKILTSWMNWMAEIEAQGQMADRGNRLSLSEAKTVRPNDTITDGPYTEIKEFINGYILVKTNTMDDAIAIAKKCPILLAGGNVEVRKIVTPDDNS